MLLLIALIAFPSTFGTKGIYRTKSADVEWILEARSILSICLDAEAYRYEYSDTSEDYGSGRIIIGYTPSKRFEGYTIWRIHGQGSVQLPLSDSDTEGDLGDFDIGGKVVLKKIKNSYLGADLALTLPIGRNQYTNDGFIIYPKALATIDFGDYWRLFPIRGHLNFGIPVGRQGLGDHFPLMFAAAFELPSRLFTYFIEVGRMHERDWNWRVTPGLRLHPFNRFSLTVAADFGITDDYWLIGANAGLSVSSVLTRERETRPTGNLAGEVRDTHTQAPLNASVTLVELDETVTSDDEYGVYRIFGIPIGVYTVVVTAPDYATETRVVVVNRGETDLHNFALTRAKLSYEGLIVDSRTERPISMASIHLDGKTEFSTNSDSDGYFNARLAPGVYTLKVNKQNYAQYVTEIALTENQYDTISIKQVEAIAETPEAVVYFDVDDANIREDQKAPLDTIAEFLKSHPTVNCELRGHTDPSGNMDYNEVLSLARANSVKDYLVKVHGIEKNRISTLAFSKTKLVKESPEKSRRVEIFFIK